MIRFDSIKNQDDSQNFLEPIPSEDTLKQYLVNSFQENLFNAVRTVTDVEDLTKMKVISLFSKWNRELIDFLLKNKKKFEKDNTFKNNIKDQKILEFAQNIKNI